MTYLEFHNVETKALLKTVPLIDELVSEMAICDYNADTKIFKLQIDLESVEEVEILMLANTGESPNKKEKI